jgi:hypothetical protein
MAARGGAISSAAWRPSLGRRRLQLGAANWALGAASRVEVMREGGALPRGKEGEGGSQARAEELEEEITRDGGHTKAAAVVKWNRAEAGGACVTACPPCPFRWVLLLSTPQLAGLCFSIFVSPRAILI